MKKRLEKILKMVYDKINSVQYMERSRLKKGDFTRNRKMSFVQTIAVLLTGMRESIQTTLIKFIEEHAPDIDTYSKQAFSKGRLRVRPEAIRELIDTSVEAFYTSGTYDTYNGYRILAVDGSKLNLPCSEELISVYGEQLTSGYPQVQALSSCLYDVLNGIIIDTEIYPCRYRERDAAVNHVEFLKKSEHGTELVILDRGYPSAELLETFDNSDIYYLMRCSSEFCKRFSITSDDCIITHRFKKHPYTATMRYVQCIIPYTDPETGEQKEVLERLITNLPQNKFDVESLKELYHLRWCVETEYRRFKEDMEIENFSGLSETVIRQDYYASIFLANMALISVYLNKDSIDNVHNTDNDNKYVQRQNIKTTIECLTPKVVKMVLTDFKPKRTFIFLDIMRKLIKCTTPVKPGRSFPRVKKHKSAKFSMPYR